VPRSPTGAPSGRPPRTSREEILTATRRLIDRDGWERLTIRKLATELGTSPATVYYHVRDKDELLVQVLNHYADQIPRPTFPTDPRGRIVAAARLMHDVLAAWPWVVEVLAGDDLLGDSALFLVETIVAGAVDAGCDRDSAVYLYRHIWYYTAGEIIIRASRTRRRARTAGEPVYRDQAFARLDPIAFPHLTATAPRWGALTSEDTYTRGLEIIIDGYLGTNENAPTASTVSSTAKPSTGSYPRDQGR